MTWVFNTEKKKVGEYFNRGKVEIEMLYIKNIY